MSTRFRKQECTANKQNVIAEHGKEIRTDGTKSLRFLLKKSYPKRSSAVSGTLQYYRWISHGKQATEHGVWKNEDGRNRKTAYFMWHIWFFVCFWREDPQWAKTS
jgi:hypothetical protein